MKNFAFYFVEVFRSWVGPIRSKWRFSETLVSTGAVVGLDCSFGKNVKIYKNCRVSNTIVGDYSYIGGESTLKNCSVGRFCSVGERVQIGLGIHPVDRISTYPGFYSPAASGVVRIGSDCSVAESQHVSVGNDVWIGNNVIIIDGVKIGNGAVIAAGAVVTKDVPAYAIVAGIPAKVLRHRFAPDEIDLLEEFAWWNKGLQFCKDNAQSFMHPASFFQMIRSNVGTKNN